MAEIVVRRLVELPLWCHACVTNHILSIDDIERIVYALQGDRADQALDGVSDPDYTIPCLLQDLRAAWDGELYMEHVQGAVEARLHAQGIECPYHGRWRGPGHAADCPMHDVIDHEPF